MRIIVKNAQITERRITTKTGEKIIREQMAAVDRGDGYETPFSIGLGTNPPYQPGEYDIDPRSFTTNEYGDLVLSRYFSLVSASHKPAPAKQ